MSSVVVSMLNFKPVGALVVSRTGFTFKIKSVSPASVLRLKELTYQTGFTSNVISRRGGLKLKVYRTS